MEVERLFSVAKKILYLVLLMTIVIMPPACSVQPVYLDVVETPDRFTRAEKYGQFIPVNRSVDCRGTKVTIEKVLLDLTGTFMIASVDGDIRGRMDYLTVDLFDGRGRELGRSTLLQKLPGDKTLLSFGPVDSAPESLRMELFGGPVGYGSGRVILDLNDIRFRKVDKKYTREYRLAETFERPGYRAVVKAVAAGVSETGINYRITALGDYDGISHGWFRDLCLNRSPEREVISAFSGGRRLGIHLSGPNCLGPDFRSSLDGRDIAGRANFGPLTADDLQVRLSDIYGFYRINEIVPVDGAGNRTDINRKLAVRGYTVHLKSFAREEGANCALDYSVLDSAGNEVDAAIEAWLYEGNSRVPYISRFKDPAGGDRRLLIRLPDDFWESPARNLMIKVWGLGIRQEDAVLDIDLKNPKQSAESRDEERIVAAVRDYYETLGKALAGGEAAVFEEKFGYLRPTGRNGDGINDWRGHLDFWRPLGVKEYWFSFSEPIVTVTGNTAAADIGVTETVNVSTGSSGRGLCMMFYLEKVQGEWRITMVDELTEAENYRIR